METKIGFNTNYQSDTSQTLEKFQQQNEDAQPNRYIESLFLAFDEFLEEERCGNCFSELRLSNKIEVARLLFEVDRKKLRRLK